MTVDLDGQRFDLADLPDDPQQARIRVQQLVKRGDTHWHPLVGGGEVLVNWRAVKTVRVVAAD